MPGLNQAYLLNWTSKYLNLDSYIKSINSFTPLEKFNVAQTMQKPCPGSLKRFRQ